MASDQDHQLDTLIRSVDSAKFSAKAHGAGFLFRHDAKLGAIEAGRSGVFEGLLDGIFARKDRFTDYFVKQLDKALVIRDWSARWLEGASELELEFKYNFEIHVRDQDTARRLVAALHRPEGPAQALRAIIEKHLHVQTSQLFAECAQRGDNVLNRIAVAAGNVAMSSELDQRVSSHVADDLFGGTRGGLFRVGLRLEHLPARVLEIEDHKTPFKIPDSKESHAVATTARLELNNFQNFKRSTCKNGDMVKAVIRAEIDNAVRRFLFEKSYYDIARNFESEIKQQIRHHITRIAAALGYEIKVFQTLPNIEVLRLSQGLRLDLRAEDYEFRPRFSTGYVRMDVSVEVWAQDYAKLARLIPPDQHNIVERLKAELVQICRDKIHTIDRKQFNLAFDASADGKASVADQLEEAFTRVLHERYGLAVEVINLSPASTAEKERYDAVRGKATAFELDIAALADHGAKDRVPISGKFEVVAIEEHGWDKFESKDFGFRKESVEWTPSRLAALDHQLQQQFGALSPEQFELERKSVAVHNELDEMARRIKSVLENYLSKIPDLANRSRTLGDIAHLQKTAEKVAKQCIEDEFGVVIAFREFYRRETLSESTQNELHMQRHQAVRERASKDVAHAGQLVDLDHKQRLEEIEYLGRRKLDKLADFTEESIVLTGKLDERLKELRRDSDWQALSPDSVKAIVDASATEDSVEHPPLGSELQALITAPQPAEPNPR